MFKLRNRLGPVRFLFQQSLNHHSHHHQLLRMAYMLAYDPCSHFSRAFSSHYPSISSPGVNRNIVFSVKGCFDFNGSGSGNRIIVKEKTKPFGFASLPRPPLLVDLEKSISVRDDGRDATLIDVQNRPRRGSPTTPFNFPDNHVSQKLVVAVDVDEVLGNFVSALNKFIADRYSSTYSVSEYHVYEFFKIWNCSRDEADIRVHEFFKTPYFKSGIHPLPGSQTALQKLSRFCNLSVVTSRQNIIKDHTIEWIEKHYPGMFQEIHFGNHFALDGVSKPKSEICRSLNAKVLIDDNPRYAIECAEAGVRVLLFDYENSYPWCKTEAVDQHPLVTKVKNWLEVEQQLMSLIAL